MTRRVLLLAGGTVAFWVLTGVPAGFLVGEEQLYFSAIAAGLCLVPATLTLILNDAFRHRPPEERLVVILGSVALRLGLTLGGGLLLYFLLPWFHRPDADPRSLNKPALWFWVWILGFYLLTLAGETGLVFVSTRPPRPLSPEAGEAGR